MRKHWILLSLGALCIAVGGYVIKGLNRLPGKASLELLLLRDGLRLSQVHYRQGDIHKGLNWKLDAKEVRLSKDNNIVKFKKFNLLLEPKEKPKLRLKGQRGEYSKVTGVLDLWGNIRAYSEDGYSAESEHLRLDENKGLLTTENRVVVSGPLFSLTGKGLLVDLKNKIFKIRSNVVTKVTKEMFSS